MKRKVITYGPLPFAGPVRYPVRPNARAHGGVTFRDVREDGATRERNVLDEEEEVGRWTVTLKEALWALR